MLPCAGDMCFILFFRKQKKCVLNFIYAVDILISLDALTLFDVLIEVSDAFGGYVSYITEAV